MCTLHYAVFRRLCAASWLATALTTVPTNRPCGPNARLNRIVVAELSPPDHGRWICAPDSPDGRSGYRFGNVGRCVDLGSRRVSLDLPSGDRSAVQVIRRGERNERASAPSVLRRSEKNQVRVTSPHDS